MKILFLFIGLAPIACLYFNRKVSSRTFKPTRLLLQATTTTTIQNNDDDDDELTITKRRPQVLIFKEPTTGTIVKLVGCMHYNPASIKLAEELVESSAKRGVLKAVLIESCPTRWEKMIARDLKLNETIIGGDKVYNNEMRAASFMARKYNVPTVLGDQEITVTTNQMKSVFIDTVKDLLTPFNGGWQNIYSQFQSDVSIALPSGENYLGNKDFLDPILLRNIPTSLLRYTSAFATKSPVFALMALFFVFILPLLFDSSSNMASAGSTAAMVTSSSSIIDFSSFPFGNFINSLYSTIATTSSTTSASNTNIFDMQESLSELVTSILGSALELILVQRVFLNALLVDRNEILASNILKICVSKDKRFFSGGSD
jgi:hypothetical protein